MHAPLSNFSYKTPALYTFPYYALPSLPFTICSHLNFLPLYYFIIYFFFFFFFFSPLCITTAFTTSCVPLPAVNLIAGPMDITVVENTTANFSCTAENPEGAPYPLQFSWKVNASGLVDLEGSDGRIITTEEVNGSVVTGYLIFTKTVPSDFGEYRCFVTNFRRGDTVSSGDAILTIQCKSVYQTLD